MELTHFSYLSKGWTRGSFYCRRKFWRRMVPVKRECHSVTWVCHTEPVQGYGFANYLNSSPEQKEMVNLEGRACPWDGSSGQFSHSVVSSSLWPHGLPHDRPPCPSPTPRVYSNSCPLNRWCHPTISSSVVPFSSCLQSSQHQGLFQGVSSLHQVMQSIGVSASTSVLPVNIQDWFPLGWLSLQSKGLSWVFSNTTVQKQWGYLINYEGLLRNSM